jgi:recombination protein RecA
MARKKVEEKVEEDKEEGKEESKQQKMVDVAKAINKNYKRVVICKASEAALTVRHAKTGSISIDIELGGGYPRGRLIELYGPWSSGKTAVCLHTVADFQMQFEEDCLWIDTSQTFDKEWAIQNGVDLDRLDICQPTQAETVINIMGAAVESRGYSLIVLDDVASCRPSEEFEKEGEQNLTMGAHARLINRLTATVIGNLEPVNLNVEEDRNLTDIIFINQMRATMDKYHPQTTTGGQGKEYFSSIRIELRRGDFIKLGKDEDAKVVGHQIKFKVEKNKTYMRDRRGVFDFYFDAGNGYEAGTIDRKTEILNYAILWGIIRKKGPWFELGSQQVQGKEKLFELIDSDFRIYEKIEEKVYAKMEEAKGKLDKIEKDREAEKEIIGEEIDEKSDVEGLIAGFTKEEEVGTE